MDVGRRHLQRGGYCKPRSSLAAVCSCVAVCVSTASAGGPSCPADLDDNGSVGVVPQHVYAKRNLNVSPDLGEDGGHRTYGLRRDTVRIKRSVAKVLDDGAIKTGLRQRSSIFGAPIADRFHGARVTRAAG